MKSVNHLCDTIKAENHKDNHNNEQGNAIYRSFENSERYVVDFATDFTAEGWEQFDTDQDAAYYGFWVNPITRQTLCYCEGDWILVECPTVESYNAEIRAACQFHGAGFILKALDTKTGTVTVVVQDRSKFLIA